MHKGQYTKAEMGTLKEKGVKPGTKSAHKVLKKKYMMADGGPVKIRKG